MTAREAIARLREENHGSRRACPDLDAALDAMEAALDRGAPLAEGDDHFLRSFAAGWPEDREALPALEA